MEPEDLLLFVKEPRTCHYPVQFHQVHFLTP